MKTRIHRQALPIILSLLIIIPFANKCLAQPWIEHGKLTVLETNPHYLSYEDGTHFLWFGDTAWELIHRLNREEAEHFLENRKNKGFNVVQAVAISERHHEIPTNYYGDSLFMKNNPLRPLITDGNDPMQESEYDYWDHLEYIVDVAEAKNLYVALLPSWGEWVIPRGNEALFNSPEEAYLYGWFLANRLKEYNNIIWVLGGDRDPDEREDGVKIWRGMAEGIADARNHKKVKHDGKADYNTTLMTHHSYNSSSSWFHTDPWIDFHMWGSYHHDFYLPRSYEQTMHDWALPDPKPTINAEPNYEDHPVNYAIAGNGVFTQVDVRNSAYWSLFSGSAGYTYGAHPVWQFTDSLRPRYSDLTFRSWQEALDLPGAYQIHYLKKLMESRPLSHLTPDQEMIVSGQGSGANYITAIKGASHAFFYIPTGAEIKVKLGVISGDSINAFWFDPRTGSSISIGTFKNSGSNSFDVPGMSKELQWLRSGRGCDWVLVLDDASQQFPAPGMFTSP